MNWEQQIEELEAAFRKQERQRTQAQLNLENFHSQVQSKLSLLSNPHEDFTPAARDYFGQKRDKLNQEAKLRMEQRAELKRRLDELRRAKQTGESRDALIDAFRRSEDELDKVNEDLAELSV